MIDDDELGSDAVEETTPSTAKAAEKEKREKRRQTLTQLGRAAGYTSWKDEDDEMSTYANKSSSLTYHAGRICMPLEAVSTYCGCKTVATLVAKADQSYRGPPLTPASRFLYPALYVALMVLERSNLQLARALSHAVLRPEHSVAYERKVKLHVNSDVLEDPDVDSSQVLEQLLILANCSPMLFWSAVGRIGCITTLASLFSDLERGSLTPENALPQTQITDIVQPMLARTTLPVYVPPSFPFPDTPEYYPIVTGVWNDLPFAFGLGGASHAELMLPPLDALPHILIQRWEPPENELDADEDYVPVPPDEIRRWWVPAADPALAVLYTAAVFDPYTQSEREAAKKAAEKMAKKAAKKTAEKTAPSDEGDSEDEGEHEEDKKGLEHVPEYGWDESRLSMMPRESRIKLARMLRAGVTLIQLACAAPHAILQEAIRVAGAKNVYGILL